MKTIGIRSLSGDAIKAAVSRNEMLGITNGRLLAGVLMPLSAMTLERLMDRNLTRIEESIRVSERELTDDEWSSLDDFLGANRSAQSGRQAPSRVAIRNLSGARLQQAADTGEMLVVTHDGVAIALLVPVTLEWVGHLTERNLSRIRDSIECSERELAADELTSLDEVLEEKQGRAAPPAVERLDRAAAPLPSLPYKPYTPYLSHLQKPEEQLIIGVDVITDAPVGRPRIVAVAADSSARPLLAPVVTPLPDRDEEQVLAAIAHSVSRLTAAFASDRRQLTGVGIQLAGHIHDGVVVDSLDVNWHHFPLAHQLRRQLGSVPVVVENNANAFALRAQLRRDIGPGETAAVILITDRGVGCGLVLDGTVFKGATGMAGEIGHLRIEHGQNVKCRCTRVDCLETIASPHAISAALGRKGFTGGFADAVEAAKNSKDDLVRATFSQAGEALGRGLAHLITLFNPSTLVLCGPESLLGPHRRFRHHAEQGDDTAAGIYLQAMDRVVTDTAFSTGPEDCERLLVRNTDDAGGAVAAACLIQRLPAPHAVLQHPMHRVGCPAH